MNKYNLSALSKKGRADIFNEAAEEGVIIQDCNTNGDVRREFVLITRKLMFETVDSSSFADGRSGDNEQTKLWHATQPNLEY